MKIFYVKIRYWWTYWLVSDVQLTAEHCNECEWIVPGTVEC